MVKFHHGVLVVVAICGFDDKCTYTCSCCGADVSGSTDDEVLVRFCPGSGTADVIASNDCEGARWRCYGRCYLFTGRKGTP